MLPRKIIISFSDLNDYIGPDETIEENSDLDIAIGDYLTDTYGFCIFSFKYDIHMNRRTITVRSIKWDTED